MAKAKLQILTGDRYGYLTIIREVERTDPIKRRFLVQCDCGKIAFALLEKLRQRRTVSCGCRYGRPSHTDDPLYSVWSGMRARCRDLDDPRYGGRGIRVCAEWDQSFPIFRDWSHRRGYEPGLQIDRENNDGNYEPSNCRWVTQAVNNANKGSRIWFDGALAALSLPT